MPPLPLILSLCLQAGVILGVCHLAGKLATKLGQPSVVGMMIAGVLLGPSMLGVIWSAGQSWVFPADTRVWLKAAAELGVGGYLFCVGLDFNVEKVRERGALALAVASAGVVVPFLLAIPLAISTQGMPGWFAAGAVLWQQVLFLGAALSITAFPMLVWIVRSKGLADSPMGLVAISAGAIGDAFAWVILAVVLASFGGSPDLIYRCVFGGLLMIAVARYVVPRLLAGIAADCETQTSLTWSATLAVALLFLTFVTFSTWCGMHAVFGGFLCGLAIPKGELNRRLRSLEPAVCGWVLPFFFVCSGLQTRLDFLFTPAAFWLLVLVVAVSLLGKGGACWCAARWAGLDAAAAGGVASLMNARGLMELILLNVGLAAGLVGPVLFSVLVVMAIVTTLMAGPLFEWTYGRKARLSGEYGGL
jgi:Kef-type K+ transport system membrane component KefB